MVIGINACHLEMDLTQQKRKINLRYYLGLTLHFRVRLRCTASIRNQLTNLFHFGLRLDSPLAPALGVIFDHSVA